MTEREGFGGGRKGGEAGVSDGKSMTVTNDDVGISGDGRGRGKVTGVGSHVSGRAGVHEPVTAATVGAGGGGGIGLKSLEKRRIRRWGGVVAGRGIGRRAMRHRVGVDDPGPRIVADRPGRGGRGPGRGRLGGCRGAGAAVAAVVVVMYPTIDIRVVMDL